MSTNHPVKQYPDLASFAAMVGQPIGQSDWVRVNQAQINQFAQATGDHQWIHVNEQRAAAGPFGAPIAHGFLTLSLVPMLFASAFDITASKMGVNYGLNKVRFINPVRVNSQVRGVFELLDATPLANGGYQFEIQATIQIRGSDGQPLDKPACVASCLVQRF